MQLVCTYVFTFGVRAAFREVHTRRFCLKCLCIENFEYTFLAKIETSVFPMHEYHIIFVLTGEKGVEISVCFEALGANFDSHCVMS